MRSRFIVLLAALLATAACKASAPVAPTVVRFVQVPEGEAAVVIAKQLEKSNAEHRRALVYVGATWCEPCQYFHQAVDRGDLNNGPLGGLDLIGFDADVDRERIAFANYDSRLIPLFVVPGPDGKSTGRQIEGSIKGPGAVEQITPRLKALLAGEVVQ